MAKSGNNGGQSYLREAAAGRGALRTGSELQRVKDVPPKHLLEKRHDKGGLGGLIRLDVQFQRFGFVGENRNNIKERHMINPQF